jgi:hypothetical protein
MRINTVLALVGAALVTALVAVRTHLPVAGSHASPEAALLVLLLLCAFAYALFALCARVVSRLPAKWPAPVRVSAVVAVALALAFVLRFYQFAPALLVLAWCKVGLPCGEVGNVAFNSLLGAGAGVVVLLLLPVVTVPILLAGYWLHQRGLVQGVPNAA